MFMMYRVLPHCLIIQGLCVLTWKYTDPGPVSCCLWSRAARDNQGCYFSKSITPALGRSLVFCSSGDSKYALFINTTIHPLSHTSSQKNQNWSNHILCFPSRIFPVLIFPVHFYGDIFFFLLIFLGHEISPPPLRYGILSTKSQGPSVAQLTG